MTSPRLDVGAIRKRAEAATEGPWLNSDDVKSAAEMWNGAVTGWDERKVPNCRDWYATGPRVLTQEQAALDEKFIAAARTDVPALCDRVEALEAENDALKAANERLTREHSVSHCNAVDARARVTALEAALRDIEGQCKCLANSVHIAETARAALEGEL